MKRFFTAVMLLCLSLQPLKAEEGADYLQQFLDGLDTFQAEFIQSLTNARGEVVERSTGMLYIHNPGQFHWAYQEPYAQRIITDGTTIWIYDQDLEQVTIKDIGNNIDNTPAAILSGSENLEKHFTIVDKGKVEGIYNLELSPVDPESQFHKIVLGFYGKYLNMMVMFDKLGQITRVSFSETKRNEALSETLFSFVPPEGTDVIDGRVSETVEETL